jgi:hypothetical protein
MWRYLDLILILIGIALILLSKKLSVQKDKILTDTMARKIRISRITYFTGIFLIIIAITLPSIKLCEYAFKGFIDGFTQNFK